MKSFGLFQDDLLVQNEWKRKMGDIQLWAQMGPRNHVLDGVQIHGWEGAILMGKGRPIVKYRDSLL